MPTAVAGPGEGGSLSDYNFVGGHAASGGRAAPGSRGRAASLVTFALRENDSGKQAMIQQLARQFGEHPRVLAVAVAGSHGAGTSDNASDFDLYVYTIGELPVDFRRALASPDAEIDNRYWEPGDEWIDQASDARVDVMYRSPAWIEEQLDRVLVRHEASIGYSTCFWYSVLHSDGLFDPRGWYASLQARARAPYPEPLRRAIIAKNYPLLRENQSSYRAQVALALQRGDRVSVQHRITALLASYFDVWFALEGEPHPGEKRLLTALPPEEANLVCAVLEARADALLASIDALLDRLGQRLDRAPVHGTASATWKQAGRGQLAPPFSGTGPRTAR